jgi:hypothetical protein
MEFLNWTTPKFLEICSISTLLIIYNGQHWVASLKGTYLYFDYTDTEYESYGQYIVRTDSSATVMQLVAEGAADWLRCYVEAGTSQLSCVSGDVNLRTFYVCNTEACGYECDQAIFMGNVGTTSSQCSNIDPPTIQCT